MYYNLKYILQYFFINIIERVNINFLDLHNNPPIFIYQFGKVGSTTVYNSLREIHIPNRVYHIHFLSQQGIMQAETFYRHKGKRGLPAHLLRSSLLRKKIDNSKDINWKIITLIRDPIGFVISSFFQNSEAFCFHFDLADDKGELNKNKVVKYLEKRLNDYDSKFENIDTWFDKEIKAVCGVDVFLYPFNHEKGYSIIREKNAEILVLRLEDLNRNFNEALTEFLSLSQPVEMIRANIGKDKKYAAAYQYVKEHIHIPQEVCERIYSSKFSTHFYDEKMREGFTDKWTRKKLDDGR